MNLQGFYPGLQIPGYAEHTGPRARRRTLFVQQASAICLRQQRKTLMPTLCVLNVFAPWQSKALAFERAYRQAGFDTVVEDDIHHQRGDCH
jgi:hypothetical protein